MGDSGDINPGLVAGGQAFVALAQTPEKAKPGEGAFDDPAPGLNHESVTQSRDNLDVYAIGIDHPLNPFVAAIAAICPKQKKTLPVPFHLFKDLFCTGPVAGVGCCDCNLQDVALCVGDHMPFSTLYPLATVETDRLPCRVVLTL